MKEEIKIRIRKARKSDIKKLLELDKLANKEIKWWFPIKPSEFSKLINKKLVYVLEHNKEIIGYLNGEVKEKQLMLEDIYIKKNFRNKGLAKKLIKKFISDWKSNFKEIRVDCPKRLKGFYEKLNFKPSMLLMKYKLK